MSTNAVFKQAWPYVEGRVMDLPVASVATATAFYEKIMGFRVVSQKDEPHKQVILERDNIRIGLAENGGDPTQEGCFFEVSNAEAAFAELKTNGFEKEEPNINIENHGGALWKTFFVVAPDGLCYCLGERLP